MRELPSEQLYMLRELADIRFELIHDEPIITDPETLAEMEILSSTIANIGFILKDRNYEE